MFYISPTSFPQWEANPAQNLRVSDAGFYKDYSKGHMFSRGLSGLQLSVAAFALNSLVTQFFVCLFFFFLQYYFVTIMSFYYLI